MKTTFIDFETFYSKEYSLKKMTPVEYVLDPRFEGIGCAVKEGLKGTAYWVDGPDLPKFFRETDPNVLMVSHNWLFDGCVLAWRYGFLPKLMACTLSMSRATIRSVLKSMALKSVAAYLDIGVKGDAIMRVEGMNRAAIIANGLWNPYVEYGLTDVGLCAGIFDRLVMAPNAPFPMPELRVMDMVLRCAIEPRFNLDRQLLAEHAEEVRIQKETILAQAMLLGADGKGCLTSNDKFAELLRSVGVDPPTKISPVTGKTAYAFAKTDAEFLAIADDADNPAAQVLVQARLGHKSTLEESRTARYQAISNLTWPVTLTGNMPMPIAYSAAHTHRLGGDWSLNVQNLRRGGKLRRALTAPAGHHVMTVDASQIEAREVGYFSGQENLTRQFANKEDVYASFASIVFGFPVNKKEHPTERFIGKQAVLGLGYGLGWIKFQSRLKTDSKNQTGNMIELADIDAMRIVEKYRETYAAVPAAWRRLNYDGIPVLAAGGRFEYGPCVFAKGEITLPGGLKLHYHQLHQDNREWYFLYAGMRHKLYGGKLLENLMQALARQHTLFAALRIEDRSLKELGVRYRLAQQGHDENVFIVADQHVDYMRRIMYEEMVRRPDWAPGLPLDAEVGVGKSYGDAK